MKKKLAKIRKGIFTFIAVFSRKVTIDHLTAFAAQAAFFVVLSFFPFLMLLLTMTKQLPITQTDVMNIIDNIIPSDLYKYIEPLINDVYESSNKAITSISIVVLLWTAAKSIMSLKNGLNTIFKIKESRNYFVVRLVAMLYTFGFVIMLLVVLLLLVFGNQIVHMMISEGGTVGDIGLLINNSRVVITTGLMLYMFIVFYQILPNHKFHLLEVLPGAVFTTFGWLLMTFPFSIYVDEFSNFSIMYGSITGIIIILVWLYFNMMIMFLGAEINYFIGKVVDT